MKIIIDADSYEFQEAETQPVPLNVQLGNGDGFSQPIEFWLDTGNVGESSILIPGSLLKKMEIDMPPIITEGKGTLADGSSTKQKESLVLLNIRILSVPSGRPIIFEGIRVLVGEDNTQPLINFGNCTMLIKNGELKLLEFNPKSLNA